MKAVVARAHPSREVVLRPGEFFFGRDDQRIRTLLGSCVAITLWHPRLRIGGMCHYLIPTRHPVVPGPVPELDGRYADEAMQMFCDEIARASTDASDYHARMFGGGNQFPDLSRAHGIDIPERNIVAGLTLLDNLGITVLSTDLGRSGARVVGLDLRDGSVTVRRIGTDNRGAA